MTSLYRPPYSRIEIFDTSENLIENLDVENKEIILVGDFNCNLLAESRLNITNRLLDIANLFPLKQIIAEATRITKETQTMLDLFFANKPENIINSGMVHLGVSDHSLIYGCRKISLLPNVTKNC